MRRRVALSVAVCAIVAAAWLLRRRQESTALAREALAYAPALAVPRERPRFLPTPGQLQAAPEGPEPKALPSELDRALGPPRWQPRPAEEWQGMRVNLNVTPPCERPDGCGMALACKGNRCGPCEFDAECATGESCVLDHCLKTSNVECHHRADCGAD